MPPPIWILFELGLFLSQFFNKRVEEASVAREERSQAEADEADRQAEELEAGDDSIDQSPKASIDAAGTDPSDAYKLAEEAEAADDSVDLSPQATAAAKASAATSIADQADALWEPEVINDDTSIDETEHKIHNEGEKVDTNPYQAFENYEPKTEEQLDAELDAIEAEELKEELAEAAEQSEVEEQTEEVEEETISELDADEIENLETELAALDDENNQADLDSDYTDRLAETKGEDGSEGTEKKET